MQPYRAISCSSADADLCRTSLDSAAISKLAGQAMNTAAHAFILKNQDLEQLASESNGAIEDRGRKNPAKPLAEYFVGKKGLMRLRAGYNDAGQAERGIRALLQSSKIPGKNAAYFIAVDEMLFEQLWARAGQTAGNDLAGGDLPPDLRAFLEENPNLQVPPTLLNEYLGNSPLIDSVRRQIVLAAKVKHPLLIEGETGTGKEIVARSIHNFSPRSAEAFLPVNCGGIPSELFESELFGHVKGAFTGALRDKAGMWTLADAGTLFLDEISDLSPAHQVKVLRALEDGRYWPVGGEKEVESGARIIAATNRNLGEMVKAGRFRDDLYYRLFTFRIRTPALREHPEDVPELAAHFWRRFAGNDCPQLPHEVLQELKNFSWPGNARELRSFLINVLTVADNRPVTLPMIRAVMRDRHGSDACIVTNKADSR